jgi:glycosyltransferase involved in cell wall biosynthesis
MTTKTAFVYGARSKTFFSGTPYYLARALEAFGKKHNAFNVIDIAPRRTREVPLTYLRWCLESGSIRNPLFLLSQRYHNRSGRGLTVPRDTSPYFIMVCCQCPPASIRACRRDRADARIILYLDATLLDLFESFDYAIAPPPLLKRKMLRDEKSSYAQADLIVVFHAGVRDRLINDYGVAPEKIWIIGRGVNLDFDVVSRAKVPRRSLLDHKLHMMVVGKGAKRKGVYRLIDAIDTLLPTEQSRLVLTVAGPDKNELPGRPYLRPLGFVSQDQRDYLAGEMAASDLGVLLSDADSLPGSVWEFLALGVPVWVSRLPCIGPALKGYPAIIEDLSLGTPALAARLRTFLHQPEILATLVASNLKSVDALSWDGPAEFLGQYIRHDRVLDKWRQEGLEVTSAELSG